MVDFVRSDGGGFLTGSMIAMLVLCAIFSWREVSTKSTLATGGSMNKAVRRALPREQEQLALVASTPKPITNSLKGADRSRRVC